MRSVIQEGQNVGKSLPCIEFVMELEQILNIYSVMYVGIQILMAVFKSTANRFL